MRILPKPSPTPTNPQTPLPLLPAQTKPVNSKRKSAASTPGNESKKSRKSNSTASTPNSATPTSVGTPPQKTSKPTGHRPVTSCTFVVNIKSNVMLQIIIQTHVKDVKNGFEM